MPHGSRFDMWEPIIKTVISKHDIKKKTEGNALGKEKKFCINNYVTDGKKCENVNERESAQPRIQLHPTHWIAVQLIPKTCHTLTKGEKKVLPTNPHILPLMGRQVHSLLPSLPPEPGQPHTPLTHWLQSLTTKIFRKWKSLIFTNL